MEKTSRKDKQEHREETGKLYEVAFHIASSVEEGKVAKEAEEIQHTITKQGGEIVSHEAPRFVELSYPISKKATGKTTTYTHAYFGSFSFSASPEQALAIKQAIDEVGSVIRFMLMAIEPGLLEERKNRGMVKGERVERVVDETKEEMAPVAQVPAGPLDEVALDKSIEQMVSE